MLANCCKHLPKVECLFPTPLTDIDIRRVRCIFVLLTV